MAGLGAPLAAILNQPRQMGGERPDIGGLARGGRTFQHDPGKLLILGRCQSGHTSSPRLCA